MAKNNSSTEGQFWDDIKIRKTLGPFFVVLSAFSFASCNKKKGNYLLKEYGMIVNRMFLHLRIKNTLTMSESLEFKIDTFVKTLSLFCAKV